jgi:hypothetical protein
MAKNPEFHFDFSAVTGLEYTEAFEALFKQMEDHYNANFQAPKLLFGGSRASDTRPQREMIDPDKISPPVVKEPNGPVDTDKITPQTVNMKTFSIKDGKELGLKEGDTILKGITEKGVEVFDKLLPGYDQQPYGPVVQGESGRYNLKRK